MEKVRCSNCRGMKKVAKLGGMMGDCNLCRGTGEIDSIKPVVVKMESLPMTNAIIEATAQALPVSDMPTHSHGVFDEAVVKTYERPTSEVIIDDPLTRIDPKKAKFRKKSKG